MNYEGFPYFSRQFRAWTAMSLQHCLEPGAVGQAAYCLDAPEMLPAGSSDSIEDLPTPTYIERTPYG